MTKTTIHAAARTLSMQEPLATGCLWLTLALMPRPTQRSLLETLAKDRLVILASAIGVHVVSSWTAKKIIATLASSSKATLPELLSRYNQNELREACRQHGLSHRAQGRAELIELLLGPQRAARQEKPLSIPISAPKMVAKPKTRPDTVGSGAPGSGRLASPTPSISSTKGPSSHEADSETAHSAVDSAVGYYHQGLYALVVLLDAGDDARVSVETADDVTVEDGIRSLHQLKHSLDPSSSFSIKNDGLWRTLKVWCDAKLKTDDQLVLVTCARLVAGSELAELTQRAQPRSAQLLAAFDAEAARVRATRTDASQNGKVKPYAKRAPGCDAWWALSIRQRKALLDRILLVPTSFSARQVPDEVSGRLKHVVTQVRPRLTERLIQWWDRQVLLALLSKRDPWLTKNELLNHIEELVVEHSARSLPNDLGDETPLDINAEMAGTMVRQIELVEGGSSRIQRAAVARWRARTQRQRWQSEDFAAAGELDEYDIRLIERWRDRFGPMKDDCESLTDVDRCRKGRELLDWSHLEAPMDVPKIRPLWTGEFLVQGTFQQFADEKRIGWHPNYEEMLAVVLQEEE